MSNVKTVLLDFNAFQGCHNAKTVDKTTKPPGIITIFLTSFCHIHRPKAASRDGQLMAVTRYSSVSKSHSQYRPFKFVIFLTRAQLPPDPFLLLDIYSEYYFGLSIRLRRSISLSTSTFSMRRSGTNQINATRINSPWEIH